MNAESAIALPPLIFDIHGVLLGRREPEGHAAPGMVLDKLRAAGYPLRFLTNSSSVSRTAMAAQLAAGGIRVAADEIYTAATAVAHYLRASARPRRLHVIGSDSLREEIFQHCGDHVVWASPEETDTVVVSRDPALTDDLLARLARVPALELIATCRDAHFPVGTRVDTGPGPTVSRVEAALGRQAWVVGKPNTYVLTDVMALTPQILSDSVIVGDSLEQDVALCRSVGARSVLVLNESVEARSVKANAGSQIDALYQPDHAITAIDQLLPLLKVSA